MTGCLSILRIDHYHKIAESFFILDFGKCISVYANMLINCSMVITKLY